MSFLLTEIATSFLRQRQEERSFEKIVSRNGMYLSQLYEYAQTLNHFEEEPYAATLTATTITTDAAPSAVWEMHENFKSRNHSFGALCTEE